MYRVLIVEDEEPVLESYEFMLRSAEGFSLSGKARTGFEALRLIPELEPDLVFMDINIPGMDGLSVIEEVYRKYPAMVFVLSTAYERFDLAQRAIPLGVFAYLVKPVAKKTFYATLDKARAHLETRIKRGDSSAEESHAGKPSRFPLLGEYLRNPSPAELSSDEWETIKIKFSLPSAKGLICLLEFEEASEKETAVLAEKLSHKYCCLFETLGSLGCIFISGDPRKEELEKYLKACLRETVPPEISCQYGIGGIFEGAKLGISFTEAQEELQKKIDYADLILKERLRLMQLRKKIGISDPDETRKLFNLLWEEIFAHCDFTLAKAKMIPVFMFLMDDISGCFGGSGIEDPDASGEKSMPVSPAEEIMALRDRQAWEAWASQAFEELLQEAGLKRSAKLPLPLAKALEYLRVHYAGPVTLNSTAEAAQVSAAYLSRLFSEQLRTGFTDYLTELRVEKAEKLLRETRMNIKEVSFAAGFQDPNYFSKIFRKATGMLPSAFRGREK
ncbi:helix-turn-helix domain-containing protein [Leadbettera azotonutricia]|uniref:Two-component response regulator n=1 Tax=Leadbettera azotonutricia (strain ATCC BAA-888 / DSM 13862 / ZAS-9) TaxID=545695 RepID=F5YBE0_LEAAZ|nr:helix-turn-helix domain-containing protein [Leadbettera azotonutricia]AEF83064.1 two-component response regulator [Leadbettera azotonutricia ZAS-9]